MNAWNTTHTKRSMAFFEYGKQIWYPISISTVTLDLQGSCILPSRVEENSSCSKASLYIFLHVPIPIHFPLHNKLKDNCNLLITHPATAKPISFQWLENHPNWFCPDFPPSLLDPRGQLVASWTNVGLTHGHASQELSFWNVDVTQQDGWGHSEVSFYPNMFLEILTSTFWGQNIWLSNIFPNTVPAKNNGFGDVRCWTSEFIVLDSL